MVQKRITLLCSSFPPETGAAPGRMYHLALMLQSKGYAVTVICAMPNYPTGKVFDAYKYKLVHRESIEGIIVIRTWLIPTHSSNKIKRAISLLSYTCSLLTLGFWQLYKSKPGLIIASSPPFTTGYTGMLLGRFTKAKCILNISDLWPQTAFELGFLKQGRLYNFLLATEQKMYRRADAFSVQSEQIKKHIRKQETLKNVFIYRNLQPSNKYAEMQRPEGKRIIVYAGLLGIAQGVFEIITSINFAASGTELHVYGQGNELDKIKVWIAAHPQNGVYYHGSVAAAEMPQLLTRYHAMLVPLRIGIEGAVPSKIFNAIANGLPVIFSGNGEAADIVARTGTGFVTVAGDYKSLEKSIVTLVSLEDNDYELMRSNCLAAQAGEFNKLVQDEQFVQFIESVWLL